MPLHGNAPVRLLTILGASGSGKSSAAQAGLLAELDRRPLPGRPSPPSVVFTPEARPLESLAVALAGLSAGDKGRARMAQEFEQVLCERGFDALRYLGSGCSGSSARV
jgi:Novel STAND NTPase 1